MPIGVQICVDGWFIAGEVMEGTVERIHPYKPSKPLQRVLNLNMNLKIIAFSEFISLSQQVETLEVGLVIQAI
jgi:hypothetical protein